MSSHMSTTFALLFRRSIKRKKKSNAADVLYLGQLSFLFFAKLHPVVDVGFFFIRPDRAGCVDHLRIGASAPNLFTKLSTAR